MSNYFYVCNTPWHPEYPHYAGRSVEDGLRIFAGVVVLSVYLYRRPWGLSPWLRASLGIARLIVLALIDSGSTGRENLMRIVVSKV